MAAAEGMPHNSASGASEELRPATLSAAAALAAQAGPGGGFSDYNLPVGPSDQWVTALAGLALVEIGVALDHEPSLDAARRAGQWLLNNRHGAAWGYNARTGPDADSTAHALLLFHALGMPAPAGSLDWLESCWRPEGGFATYPPGARGTAAWDKNIAWNAGHVCVTPPAFLALWRWGRRGLAPQVADWLQRMQRPDGGWRSYWWRTPRWGEFQALLCLRETGPQELLQRPPASERRYDFATVLELTLILGVEALREPDPAVVLPLAHELLRHRTADGGWPGSLELRVTEPDCVEPWNDPRGELYTDHNGVVGTSMALRVLALLQKAETI